MRRFLLCALLLAAGCSVWRPGVPQELRAPSAETRLLLVTTDRAVTLDVLSADERAIRGTAVQAWQVSPPTLTTEGLERLRTSSDAPEALARSLRWSPSLTTRGGERLVIPTKDVVLVRVFEPRLGRSITLGVGLGLAATALAVVLVFAASGSAYSVPSGRPLRVKGRSTTTAARRGTTDEAWVDPLVLRPVPEREREALVAIWTTEARAEHAAVAAFSKLSLELVALGAPPDLIARASRAALEEVTHARLCFSVASAYAGERIGPAPLPQALAGDTPDLWRLARESLLDGCIGEGLAAEVARLGAEHAHDPEIARVMSVQASDEQRHAALSWDIVDWALAREGAPLRRSLLAALDAAPQPRCDELPAHGRVGRALVEPCHRALVAAAHARLADAEHLGVAA